MAKNQSIDIPEYPVRFERVWAMPSHETFSIPPIAKLLAEEVDSGLLYVDPFARGAKIARVTNDLDESQPTDYHMDAVDFLKTFQDGSVDGVLYDPPYSYRQISEHYRAAGYAVTKETTQASFFSNIKTEIARIAKIGCKVISFGWNSGGIGKKLGFQLRRVLLVPHGGHHNDTICTVEVKVR